jgi:CRP-like cAMP-binding protein
MVNVVNDRDQWAQIPLFKNVSREILGVLALSAQTMMVRAGHLVCRSGEMAHGGYLVSHGVLAPVEPSGIAPQVSLRHMFLPEGSFIGLSSLLTPTRWELSLYAYVPTTLMFIHRRDFLRVVASHPEIAPPLREYLGQRLDNFIKSCRDTIQGETHLNP